MSLLDPLSHVLASVLAAAHTGLTRLGADPATGLTWTLAIAVVVVAVRLVLLPLAVHGVRQAHAAARARPQLRALAKRHRGQRDPEKLRAYAEERRRVHAEHGVSRWGCLPVLVQLPVWFAFFHLVTDLAAGAGVGPLDAATAATLAAATLAGVPLADRGYLGSGPAHLAVVLGLAASAALVSFVTQRFFVAPNAVLTDLPETVARAQHLMPAVSAVGLLVAGGVVPVALLLYWLCSQVWTLGWSAVVWRCWPTPGSRAALRHA